MYGRTTTVAFVGIEAKPIEVEARITSGRYAFSIVGLPDKAVAESRERVRNALLAVGLGLPWRRTTVNLAPGDLPKEGSHYDLPIALALMVATGALSPEAVRDYVAIGELALDGSIRTVPGGLPAAIGANALSKGLICPEECGPEAAWAGEHVPVIAAPHILSLVNHFRGTQMLRRPEPNISRSTPAGINLRDVKGQETAKRALEIGAAGGHNLLMIGPPGSGKSMLAARLPSILPPLQPNELLEVSMVHSLAGELKGGRLVTDRPFRAPHHSASMAALVGGGVRPKPGEISLAHHGVLFLDELPEFNPNVLDALRQPLETSETVIARANYRASYPARVQLIAAMNPCKCGGGRLGEVCRRGPRCSIDYQARVSGPLLDRFDLTIEVPATSADQLAGRGAAEGSLEVSNRVAAARRRQAQRCEALGLAASLTNAAIGAAIVDKVAEPGPEGRALLEQATTRLGLTARGYHRTLKVARTIADLEAETAVTRRHVAEALSYRRESAIAQRSAA
jgi:magnesium chelatase family protein